MIEAAVFRNNKGRFLFVPVRATCERCGNKDHNGHNDGGGPEVGPRYSNSASKVLVLCARCAT